MRRLMGWVSGRMGAFQSTHRTQTMRLTLPPVSYTHLHVIDPFFHFIVSVNRGHLLTDTDGQIRTVLHQHFDHPMHQLLFRNAAVDNLDHIFFFGTAARDQQQTERQQ